jgi:HAD superfamily hydrolase (TIGR01484 family)
MSASENILQHIRLFVTDADGTLLGRRPEFEQYRAFRVKIDELRTHYRTFWVVCTGRSLRSFNSVFLPMRTFGIVPDYVIARHAYIYEKIRVGYKPHWLWNIQVLHLQGQDMWRVRRAIPRLRRAVLSRNPFARVVFQNAMRICFKFDDDGAANFGAEIIHREAKPYKHLQVFHHLREVDVRTVPFTKGLAVTELARHLGVPPGQILVVGDGHNDISMMEMHPAIRTACPSNAAAEVIETVHRTGGHIAGTRSLGGVMDILTAYESGAINSRLPDNWQVSRNTANPLTPPIRAQNRLRQGLFGFVLFMAVLYTTLVVLASFGVIPGGAVIMKPYLAFISLLERLIAWIRG